MMWTICNRKASQCALRSSLLRRKPHYAIPSRSLRTRRNGRAPPALSQEQQEKAARNALALALKRINRLMRVGDDSCSKDSFPVLTQFLEDCALNCRIAPSTIPEAGRGLFAARDVRKGDIITLYPAHCLGLEIDGDQEEEQINFMVFSSPQDQAYFEGQPNWESEQGNNLLILEDNRTPIFDNDEDAVLNLDVNPERPLQASWLSHIINDGGKAQSYSESAVLDYYRETNEKRNCFHIPLGPSPWMATVATKDIPQGQEYFTSYDFLYWVVDLVDVKEGQEDYMLLTGKMGQNTDAMEAEMWESADGVELAYKDVIAEVQQVFQLTK